jgi:hypothetical protein
MATEFWVRDSAQFRKAKEVWVRDATDWRKAKEVWVRDATDWRKVYQGFQVVVGSTNYSVSVNGTVDTEYPAISDLEALVAVHCYTDGTGVTETKVMGYTGVYGPPTLVAKDWGSPALAGIGSAYHARLVINSGDAVSFGGTGWRQLNSNIYWYWIKAQTVTLNTTFYIDISADGGSTWVRSPLSTASIGWDYI